MKGQCADARRCRRLSPRDFQLSFPFSSSRAEALRSAQAKLAVGMKVSSARVCGLFGRARCRTVRPILVRGSLGSQRVRHRDAGAQLEYMLRVKQRIGMRCRAVLLVAGLKPHPSTGRRSRSARAGVSQLPSTWLRARKLRPPKARAAGAFAWRGPAGCFDSGG